MRLRYAALGSLLLACTSSPSAPDAALAVDVVDVTTDVTTDVAPSLDGPEDLAPVDVAPADTTSPVFLAAPYGTNARDTVGPFVLPTSDGDFDFRASFTGEDHYVFLTHAPGTVVFSGGVDYFARLFDGSVLDMLDRSPQNVHYFFLWYRDLRSFQAFETRVRQDLDGLPEAQRAHWLPRIHFVTPQANLIEGWVGDLVRARLRSTAMNRRYEMFQFAIDRTQHVREVGQLGRLGAGGVIPDLTFLADEPKYYEFEYQRAQRMNAERATTVIPLLERVTVTDETFPTVTLPDATAMAGFDTMEVDLTMDCVGHRDGECGAWDYISDLRVCEPVTAGDAGVVDVGDATAPHPTCNTEIARWITSYWREGHWVTDISQMLPILRAGGAQQFRWYASRQFDPRPANYVVSLSLRLSNRARGMRPIEARPLFGGGALNSTYNPTHMPVNFTVPEGTRRTEVWALITGHGSETQQCAEFCNHTHHFAVNGTDHALTFPEAQSRDGCRDRVDQGVVPNQHGTWYFGRGGWCPGWEVRPFVADVTADLSASGMNELRYRALIGTQEPAAGRGYGNVDMSAYLVFWR